MVGDGEVKGQIQIKTYLSLAASLLLSACAFAQVGPDTITSTQCVPIDTGAGATVAIFVSGTWTGTLQPQGTIQGQTAFNVQVAPSTSTTPQSTITANGAYVVPVAGYSSFQLCGNTVASGTAIVYLTVSASQLVNSAGGFGGGVTNVATGSGLTGGPITSTGTISLLTALPNGTTATTQLTGDNTGDVASDAFVQAAIAGITPSGGGTFSGTGLISGCGVEWTGLYNFTVGACTYLIAGTQYSSILTNETLAAPDATLDRIDVIGVDNTGSVFVIAGALSATPVQPTTDPTSQLALTFVYVTHNTTVPTQIVAVDIYHENAEWTSSKSGAPITLAATVTPPGPYDGTKYVGAIATVNGNFANFVKPAAGTVDLANYNNLVFYLRSTATWPAARSLTVQWYSGATAKGTPILIRPTGTFGFNSSITTTYQQISIPANLFGLNGIPVTGVRFTTSGTNGGTTGWGLDDITLQGGATTQPNTFLTWKGTWNASAGYNVNDVVYSGAVSWVALNANTASTPTATNANWAQVALPGDGNAAHFLNGAGAFTTPAGSGGTVTSAGLSINGGSTSGLFAVSGSPVTTSGTLNYNLTGTSGGIPYFSSTSVMSAGGILNTNVLVKGGGAGSAPTNSSVTDNATTVTSTDTGGYVAPVFTANGTTAGFLDLPQGTTSAAVAPCNTATSICFQAPTSVTSYLVTLAGAASTGIPHYANSANVITETIGAIVGGDITSSVALAGSPTTTTQSVGDNTTKIATDQFVTTAIAQGNPAIAVLAASTANITGTYTSVGAGIGDTFTVTATGAFTLDGIAINTIGQRVLLKDQTDATQNGVYTATVVGISLVSPVFTRALDYDQPSDINYTAAIQVQSGTVNALTSWLLVSQITSIGPAGSNLTYSQIGRNPNAIVTSVATTSPITGGTITSTGTIACATCVTSAASLTNKGVMIGGGGQASSTIDFPTLEFIPAANCNNTTAGASWSIGASGVVTCRAGTNNLGGYIAITDTSTTFAQFMVEIPEDWDTATNPYIRFMLSSTDTTNTHTIIPAVKVSCPTAGDGTTTDDATFAASHSSSTITIGGSANAHGFYNGSNVQFNSTDMTGCIAGGMMIVQVGRATDTATNAEFWGATITWPRLIVVQAN